MGDVLRRAVGPIMGVTLVLLAPHGPLCASCLLVPLHLVDPHLGLKADYRDTTARFLGGFIHAMSDNGLLLLLGFSDLHGMDPLVVIRVLAIYLGINLGLEEPDIGTNPGGGGGRVEEGGQGGLTSILYRKDHARVQVSFRVLLGIFIIYLIQILETSCIKIFLLQNYNGSVDNFFLFFL
jgi:hypothetical protein